VTESLPLPTPDAYALQSVKLAEVPAPSLAYQPPRPQHYHPAIALIGAGGISASHLDAYARARLNVAVICDVHLDRAAARRDEFFPAARVCTDPREVFENAAIQVIDLAVHPSARVALVEQALLAGKHVLSQKPFVLDLAEGARLLELARVQRCCLAVNHNGRWAPHFAYMREAVLAGLIGKVQSVNCEMHWDHSWTAGSRYEEMDDLILFDFGIHWFDFITSIIGNAATRVYATRAIADGQPIRPPMLAQSLIEFPHGQASIVFDANTRFDPQYRAFISGTSGTLSCSSDSLSSGVVTLATRAGKGSPALEGSWFNDGFLGSMGELLSAIEQGREPANSAASSLNSLALCFAAVQSAHTGLPEQPHLVRTLWGMN
jgi:predicted dehydrogenase